MKVNVIKLEVEGESHEIRDALPAILTPTTNTELTPAPRPALVEAPSTPVAEIEAPAPAPEPASAVDIVLPHEVTPDEADAWTPELGPTSPLPTKRIETWQEVPQDRRVWGSGCHTCHVLTDPQDPYSTFCGHDVGAAFKGRRVASDAGVCGNCNRRIEEAARP